MSTMHTSRFGHSPINIVAACLTGEDKQSQKLVTVLLHRELFFKQSMIRRILIDSRLIREARMVHFAW